MSGEHVNVENETPVDFRRGDLDDSIPSEIVGDDVVARPLSDMIAVDFPPHGIGAAYISEGFILPCEVEKEVYIRHGRFNEKGIGRGMTQKSVELTPLIVLAELPQPEGAWLDAEPRIILPQIVPLDGGRVKFASFTQFDNMMDTETVATILRKEHGDINIREIFGKVRAQVRRLIEMPDPASTLFALWIIGTYVHDAFEAFPYLWFNGSPGTGKTRCLELAAAVCYHADMNMDVSNAYLFRKVDAHKCTICYDEAENLFITSDGDNRERISLFNGGYRAGGYVSRVEKDSKDNYVVRKFRSFSPKALASVHPLEETLQTRCILFGMMKAMDPIKSNEYISNSDMAALRRHLYLFRFAVGLSFHDMARDTKYNEELRAKDDLKNRDWELFKPILILADQLCPEWLDEVRDFIDHQKIIRQFNVQFSKSHLIMYQILDELREAENAPDDARTEISYKELMARTKENYSELKGMSMRALGTQLRQLGLAELCIRRRTGFSLTLDRERIMRAAKYLGLSMDEMASPVIQGKIESFKGAE